MSPSPIQHQPAETGSLQILLIEDNPGDARLVEELLYEGNQSVTLRWEEDLESGVNVLKMAPRPSLDVLVIDLDLPDSSGTDTVERVTRAVPNLPVVVLTGQQDLETAIASLEVGATDFLRKEELTPSLLERTLRWALERKEMDIERTKREQKLEHRATHDALTGLPNRLALHKELQSLVEEPAGRATINALLYLDLDRFKQVNDSLGHSNGDELLTLVADRLKRAIRQSDLVARLGGDEFAVCLSGVSDAETVYHVAERIYEELSDAFALNGRDVYAPASIGVVVRLSRYDSAEDALRDADAAMYEAKEQVRRPFVVYENSLSPEVDTEVTLDTELRHAVEHSEFTPYFHPILDHRDGSLKRMEVLARWDHPERGVLSPSAFLSTAETTGLIVPLGHQVVEKASRAVNAVKAAGGSGFALPINANFSQLELLQSETHSLLARLFEKYEVAPASFRVEVTERAMDRLSSEAILSDLKELGVSIVLDDFGTEFSSLQMLKDLPVDGIKLDKGLVSGVSDDEESRILVESVVQMAHKLGVDITAEGIETPAQLAALRQLGCPSVQGFLFSHPLPKAELNSILRSPPWSRFWE